MIFSAACLITQVIFIFLQYFLDGKKIDFFNPKNLFQIYLIIQIPLVLFLGVNFSIPGYVQLSENVNYGLIELIGCLSVLGHFIFMLAYYLTGNIYLPKPIIGSDSWNKKNGNYLYIFLMIFGYLALFYLSEVNGGFLAFIENRESWRAGGMLGQGWLLFPCTSGLAIATLVYIINNAEYFKKGYSLPRLLLLILVSTFPALLLGFRGLILLPILQIMFAYNKRVKTLNLNKLVFPVLLVLIFFTFYGIYREASGGSGGAIDFLQIIEFTQDNPEFLFSVFLRSKGADVLAIALPKIIYSDEYLYFYPALYEALTIAIPSGLWADKPLPLSVIFSENFFGTGGGVSPTVIGETYWHMGVVGVVVGMASLGVIMRLYANSVLLYAKSDSFILFLATVFPLLIMMAETIQGYLNGIVMAYIFCSIINIFLSLKINKI